MSDVVIGAFMVALAMVTGLVLVALAVRSAATKLDNAIRGVWTDYESVTISAEDLFKQAILGEEEDYGPLELDHPGELF